jgi:signal transduction histidine kinase
MATDALSGNDALLNVLGARDWAVVLEGVSAAEAWLRTAIPGDPRIDQIVSRLLPLAYHSKWEIRRAVAHVAAQALHASFDDALARLAVDDNARVRQAATSAALRRRDWQNASALGRQHEDRINTTLDDIEARFGLRGRTAVRRASEQIADIFARELYHEVIKLLTPLAMSADRLRTQLSNESAPRADLATEAARIGGRVAHLRAVLDGMRAYTAQPQLAFASALLRDIIEEAVLSVRESGSGTSRQPSIAIDADGAVVADVSRVRLAQALTNVLRNAVESYQGLETLNAIVVRGKADEEQIVILVEDSGCGMSPEDLADATLLFATNKENGTGFGLPLAIKIVESEHRGRLSLESTKGRGTIVRIVIPSHRP